MDYKYEILKIEYYYGEQATHFLEDNLTLEEATSLIKKYREDKDNNDYFIVLTDEDDNEI